MTANHLRIKLIPGDEGASLVGNSIRNGHVDGTDPQQALAWFTQVVWQYFAPTQLELGAIYYEGRLRLTTNPKRFYSDPRPQTNNKFQKRGICSYS